MHVSARTARAAIAAAAAFLLLQQRPSPNAANVAGTAATGVRAADQTIQRQGRLEPDTNRPGGDYKDYDVREGGAEACQSDCAKDASCGSFTFVKPGIRGRFGHCFLKRGTPSPVADRCCISGVKSAR